MVDGRVAEIPSIDSPSHLASGFRYVISQAYLLFSGPKCALVKEVVVFYELRGLPVGFESELAGKHTFQTLFSEKRPISTFSRKNRYCIGYRSSLF